MKKSFSILKGIGWVVSKMGFVKKCGDTITAFLEALEMFETKSHQIWDKPKVKENEKTIKNLDNTNISDTSVDTNTDENGIKNTKGNKK